MSNVYGADPLGGPGGVNPAVDPRLVDPTLQGIPSAPIVNPSAAAAAPQTLNGLPVVSPMSPLDIAQFLLMTLASAGINPIQWAQTAVTNPEAAAQALEGTPTPDDAAAAASVPPDAGVGAALTGAPAVGGDYTVDPTQAPTGAYQSAMGAPPAPLPAGQGTEVGIVPSAQAAPPAPGQLGALLTGIRPPQTPQPQAVGSPGVPQPNALQTTPMDEIIRQALAVSSPQSHALTLQDAIRRS